MDLKGYPWKVWRYFWCGRLRKNPSKSMLLQRYAADPRASYHSRLPMSSGTEPSGTSTDLSATPQ